MLLLLPSWLGAQQQRSLLFDPIEFGSDSRSENRGVRKKCKKVLDLPRGLPLVEHREEREGSSSEKGKWDTIPPPKSRHENMACPRRVQFHLCHTFVQSLSLCCLMTHNMLNLSHFRLDSTHKPPFVIDHESRLGGFPLVL